MGKHVPWIHLMVRTGHREFIRCVLYYVCACISLLALLQRITSVTEKTQCAKVRVDGRGTHLLPSQGLLTCWSQSWPVQPASHSQLKEDWPVGWQVPCPHWGRLQGWHPGSTPDCSRNCVRSWSSPLMYRLRMQPWKLVPLRPGPCRKAAKPT